jgi:hypothetical protein
MKEGRGVAVGVDGFALLGTLGLTVLSFILLAGTLVVSVVQLTKTLGVPADRQMMAGAFLLGLGAGVLLLPAWHALGEHGLSGLHSLLGEQALSWSACAFGGALLLVGFLLLRSAKAAASGGPEGPTGS